MTNRPGAVVGRQLLARPAEKKPNDIVRRCDRRIFLNENKNTFGRTECRCMNTDESRVWAFASIRAHYIGLLVDSSIINCDTVAIYLNLKF